MEEKQEEDRKIRIDTILVILAVALIFISDTYASSTDENATQRIVDRAQVILNDFIRDPKKVRLRANLDHAKGVLIFPEVLQGGFIVGGAGGTGIFFAEG